MGLNLGEDMDVCKCIGPLWHGGTLNSRRTTIPVMWLVEGEESRDEFQEPRPDSERQVALVTTPKTTNVG
ncbi:hypothetical protein TNCV_2975961 [Trichonephila clavipes]|nr:hypothetical protein TNCV_2975961 [Trichonephila clavipes]